MVDELMRRFRDRSGEAPAPTPLPQVTLAAVNPAPKPEIAPEASSPVIPPSDDEAVETCGCFDATRGQRSARGFRVRVKDHYFSCQYLAFLRTGEISGWDADLGKEVLYLIFHWGTLVITGKGLIILDDLLNDHKITRLSLGEGAHGVRIDDIRAMTREAAPAAPARRTKGASV